MIHKRFEELKLSGNLPSSSGVGLAIVRQTQRDDASIDDLLRSLQADPALTGRIIKLANSVRMSGIEPAVTVRQAAMRLGSRTVRSIALGFTLLSSNRNGACGDFDYDGYWASSLACAVAAQCLTRHARLCDPSEAFTLGLLSRVGMLALASVHPDTYAHLIRECSGKPPSVLLAAETRAFDIDHWEVTASMMAEWGLPELHSNAILVLGHPLRLTEDVRVTKMVAILDTASRLAEWLLGDATCDEPERGRDWSTLEVAARKCGLDDHQMHAICADAVGEWHEWGDTFKVPTVEGTPPDASTATGSVVHAFSSAAEETLPSIDPGDLVARAHEDGSSTKLAPIKLLVVDDDPRLLMLLEHHLTRAGYLVSTAPDGREGLRLALEEAPNIIVTDWMMPELSGLDLCKELRSLQAERKPYIVILTAREDEDRIVDAFNAGADEYVTKPFNPRIVLARVQVGRRLIELQRKIEADQLVRINQLAEMGLMTRKLRAAALTDLLTDLPNRRNGMSRLEQEWLTSARSRRPLSLVMIDIDHFKKINDQFGHDIGDLVLRSTASALRMHTRKADLLFRFGGEEFLVVSPNSDLGGAWMIAERLRAAVEANAIKSGTFDAHVTISLGVATRTAAHSDADDLLKAADRAVYEAKAAGRNQVGGARPQQGNCESA